MDWTRNVQPCGRRLQASVLETQDRVDTGRYGVRSRAERDPFPFWLVHDSLIWTSPNYPLGTANDLVTPLIRVRLLRTLGFNPLGVRRLYI